MKLIIDRFEEIIAVCEDENRKVHNIPINSILGSPKEGDVIEKVNGVFIINQEETEKRKKFIEELTRGMWQ